MSDELIEHRELALHAKAVALQKRVGPQVAADMTLESWQDVLGGMVLAIRSKIYSAHVDHQEQRIPWTAEVEVSVPTKERENAKMWFLLSAGFLLLGIVSLLSGGDWITAALVAFFVWDTQHEWRKWRWTPTQRTVTETVSGTVTVQRDTWDTFPDNQMVYPPHLGTPVRIVETTLKEEQ